MLAFMRRIFVGSWLGRILAMLIFLSFAAWGMGGFFSNLIGGGVGNGVVANVAGRQISAQEFDRTYRHGLASAARSQNLSDPLALPYPQRRQVAAAALQQLVYQAVVGNAAARIGLVVPDTVVRAQIVAEKAFAGPDGKFSRALFDQRLQAAGFTQDQFVALIRGQTAANGLIEPMRVGVRAPDELVRRAFAYAAEQRVLDLVTLPFAAVSAPPAPDDAVLRRAYDNNKAQFVAPEYRRIKLVLLSPDTIARDQQVSEADERKAYDELLSRYQVPEKRSVQLLIVPDAARAGQLAGLWRGGMGWTQLQAAAHDATPLSLDQTSQAAIPSPDLARLVFAAQPGSVVGPTKTEAGWVVLRVGAVTPPQNRDFAQVRDELRQMIGAQRATGLLSARVQKLQDAIAGGGLDAIPADLGAVAAEGTLDAQGMTRSGEPAPLPGSDAVRKAMIAHAFSMTKGQAPTLEHGPENSWYAVQVEDITPAAPLAFVQVADKVRAFWQQQQVRHADEQQAATLYADAQAKGGLAAIATGRQGFVSGVAVRRGQASGAVPANLVQLAFSLKPGTSTMLETPDGFVVATVTAIRHPDPASDRLGYDRTRSALDASMADDVETGYLDALRERARPKIDAKTMDAVVGAPGGSAGDAADSSGNG